MKKSTVTSPLKALELMQALTGDKRRRLFAWLLGELGSSRHPVYLLAESLARLSPSVEIGSLSSEHTAEMLLGESYEKAIFSRMRANIGVLVTYLEDFLVFERIRKNPIQRRILLIEALTELKLGHLNQQHLQRLDEELSSSQARQPEHYQWEYKASKLKRYHAFARQPGPASPHVDPKVTKAIESTLIELIRIGQFSYEYEKNDKLIELVILFYKSVSTQNNDVKNSEILIFMSEYFKLTVVAQGQDYKPFHVKNLMNLIITYKKIIPLDIMGDAFINVMNYASRYAFKHGTKEARVLLWHINSTGLTHGFLASYGKTLPPHRFRLFVNSAIWSGEVTRQELLEIIQSDAMQKLLPRMKGNEALVFCEAYYDMVEGKFADVVARLEKARFRNEFYKAESKVLILKALYERMYGGRFSVILNDIEAVTLKVAYASRLIPTFTTLSEQQQLMFMTELKLIAALVRARSNYDLQRLEARLKRSDMAGFNRFWFEDKIQQRKKK